MTRIDPLNIAIDAAMLRYADRCATITPEGQRVSFADLHRGIRAFSARLRQLGIGPGQVVVPFSENPSVFVTLALALLRVGATVPLVMSADAAIRNGLKVDAVISLADRPSLLSQNIMFDETWFSASGDESIGPEGMWIAGSSGTTGLPKYYLYSTGTIQAWLLTRLPYAQVLDTDAVVTLPVASGFGFWLCLEALLGGGAFLRPKATAQETLRDVRAQQRFDIMTTPALLRDMLKVVEDGTPVPKNLGRIMLGGSSVSRNLARAAEAALGVPVLNAFGSIETGGNSLSRPALEPEEQNVIGIPFKGVEMRVEDANGNLAPAGTDGVIAVRVPPGSRAIKALTGTFPYDGDGWFRSGDLGVQDAEGRIVLTGRSSELINSSGFKVAPSRYEGLVLAASDATEVAAFGLPNELGSEDVGIAVICPGTLNKETLLEVLQTTASKTAKFHIFQVESLPVNPTGKIDRIALRAQFALSSPEAQTDG